MSTVTEHTQNGPSQTSPADAGRRSQHPQGRQRVLTHPQDVLALVLRQIDTVNTAKDDLTIALKGLMDLTKQLAQAYMVQVQAIQGLQGRVKALETPAGSSPTFAEKEV
jgi:hypothetical protein